MPDTTIAAGSRLLRSVLMGAAMTVVAISAASAQTGGSQPLPPRPDLSGIPNLLDPKVAADLAHQNVVNAQRQLGGQQTAPESQGATLHRQPTPGDLDTRNAVGREGLDPQSGLSPLRKVPPAQ